MIKSEENPALTAASLLPFTPALMGSSLFRGGCLLSLLSAAICTLLCVPLILEDLPQGFPLSGGPLCSSALTAALTSLCSLAAVACVLA